MKTPCKITSYYEQAPVALAHRYITFVADMVLSNNLTQPFPILRVLLVYIVSIANESVQENVSLTLNVMLK